MQKLTIIGNLGRKPEERFTQNGKKVISFTVAVRVSKDKTQWYDIPIWEDKIPQFEGMMRYLDKGSRICIVGDLGIPETYQGKDGETKIRMRINPDSLNFVGSAEKNDGPSVQQSGTVYQSQTQTEQMHFGPGPNDLQEEIPF